MELAQTKPRDLWECRYFVPELPMRLAHEKVQKISNTSKESVEKDVYLIASEAATNIKVRKRKQKPSIKIKVLLERKDDGFELWHTEFESALPVLVEVWDDLLPRLRVEGDSQLLAGYSDPDDVVKALCKVRSNLAYVETEKRRIKYESETATLDVAHVRIRTNVTATVLHSVGFESSDLARARELHGQLWADDLGSAENYVSVCSRVAFETFESR